MLKNLELYNIDANKLIAAVEQCEADVYLVSEEGDKLNLKSKLCQFIGIKKLLEGSKVATANLECVSKKDEKRLFDYLASLGSDDELCWWINTEEK
jgi:hypothetical protein